MVARPDKTHIGLGNFAFLKSQINEANTINRNKGESLERYKKTKQEN